MFAFPPSAPFSLHVLVICMTMICNFLFLGVDLPFYYKVLSSLFWKTVLYFIIGWGRLWVCVCWGWGSGVILSHGSPRSATGGRERGCFLLPFYLGGWRRSMQGGSSGDLSEGQTGGVGPLDKPQAHQVVAVQNVL